MDIEIKRMNNTATLVFSDFYITGVNWGSKCKECKISRFLVNTFFIFVVVIYFLTVYIKLRPPISSHNIWFGSITCLLFMSAFLKCKECKNFFPLLS